MALTKISRSLLDTGISDSSDATAITIDSSENVGIGITSPKTNLDIASATGAVLTLTDTRTVATTGDLLGKINFYNSDASGDGAQNAAAIAAFHNGSIGNGGIITFSTTTGSSGSEGAEPTERVRILADGKVGIGKTDPNYPLVVAGTNPKIQIYDSAGSGQTNLYFGDSGSNLAGYIIYQHSDDRMRIGTNATDVIDILSSGHVGIGSDSPSADLYVQSPDDSTCLFAAGGTYAFGINRQGASGTNYGWYLGTTASNKLVVYDGAGTGRFEVTTSSAGFISDRDQKENITDLAYGLETVKKLKPKKFKFKDVEEMEIGDIVEENKEKRILEGDYNIGFIAQEMVEEVPEIVSGTDGQGDMKIDYAAFTSVLTKAIQEQQEQIEALQSEINTLKGG